MKKFYDDFYLVIWQLRSSLVAWEIFLLANLVCFSSQMVYIVGGNWKRRDFSAAGGQTNEFMQFEGLPMF